MACTCENIDCTQSTIEGVVYCTCTTIISNITCPPGCTTIIRQDGNVECSCLETTTPTVANSKVPVFFDNDTYFKDASWTISYKLTEGSWNSYQTFYPDYSLSHNGFFQVGYNFGQDKGTVWNHLLSNNSFCVFQGRKNDPIIELPIINENVNKMLDSISLNIDAVHYVNDWDRTYDKNISFKNLFIYNQTNNSGMLGLNPQKMLSDNRKYPQTNANTQEILFTSNNGEQSINYFFNRIVNAQNNIPMFTTDSNNIFKTINTNAIKFSGKKVLERIRGDWFILHLQGSMDSRYNLILKNVINTETISE